MALIDGEPVIFSARLAQSWKQWRSIDCCVKCTAATISLGGFFGLFYLCCGASSRDEEFSSFHLHLTSTALHFSQKVYGCGCCCQTTTKKSIPLDKIQDVVMVSDCCGDTCGYMPPGVPWRIEIQTAGSGGGGGDGPSPAELVVLCIENPETFRSNVLAAKRALTTPAHVLASAGHVTGADKVSPYAAAMSAAAGSGVESREAIAVLERIERAVNEGLAILAARR